MNVSAGTGTGEQGKSRYLRYGLQNENDKLKKENEQIADLQNEIEQVIQENENTEELEEIETEKKVEEVPIIYVVKKD